MENLTNVKIVINTFAFVGAVVIVGFFIAMITCFIAYLKEVDRIKKRKKIYKNRFNKPPLAKCYCKDCEYWNESGFCNAHSGWATADNWFCWAAEPRK